jgi:Holliday junction resolvase RusA-like endonuclease
MLCASFRLFLSVPGLPIGQPRQTTSRDTRGVHYRFVPGRHAIHGYRQSIALVARAEMGSQLPCQSALRLRALFLFPRPSSRSFVRKTMGPEWHLQAPDLDNLVKGLLDALKGIAFRDDRQVVAIETQKRTALPGQKPGTLIELVQCHDNREAADWELLTFPT